MLTNYHDGTIARQMQPIFYSSTKGIDQITNKYKVQPN